jgi:hypothetical protein
MPVDATKSIALSETGLTLSISAVNAARSRKPLDHKSHLT